MVTVTSKNEWRNNYYFVVPLQHKIDFCDLINKYYR